MRSRLIWLAIFVVAVFYLGVYIVGHQTAAGQYLRLEHAETSLAQAINIVATMAIGLGIINLFHVHGKNIAGRKKDWMFSVVVFITFFTVAGFLAWESRIDATERALESRTAAAVTEYRQACEIADPVERDRAIGALPASQMSLAREFYEHQAAYHFRPREFYLTSFINPLAQTVMGLLGFYITYAAYRAFRVQSLEASVMMVSAAIVILGSDAIGGWFSAVCNGVFGGNPIVDLPRWADLDNRVANSGMQRGLWIGISIAIVAVSLRTLLGFEKGMIEVRRSGD